MEPEDCDLGRGGVGALGAAYQEAEDLINIGAYVRGSNPRIDYALDKIEAMIAYLKQPIEQRASLEESQAVLQQMFSDFQW